MTIGHTEGLDERFLAWIANLRTPSLDRFFGTITWAGSNFLLLPLTVVLAAWLLTRKQTRMAIFCLLATVGVIPWTQMGKYLVSRPRPDLVPPHFEIPSGYSFPSAHAAQIVAFVMVGTWALKRSYHGPWLLVIAACGGALIALVCFSRLYLAVHYPSDVLAGILAAGLWVTGLLKLPQATARPNDSSPDR